ncbi:peptide/nickel transport system substrate-binding protein [Bosea sp. CRIB-10]|nr:peptide/nickel transport system substrate-binding protein [Bosea sp. CRIB-10]
MAETGNRMRFRSRREVLALGLGAAALAAGGAQAQPRPPQQPKGQVVAGLSQEPTVFNPLMPGSEVDQGVWWQLFSPLWFVDPDGKLVPDLATEVPSIANGGLSADGLSWKVKLRRDAKWHDGTPFTAEDVKYTLDLINTPGFRVRNRVGHSLLRDIRIVAPDEIHWRMESAYSPYLSILALTFIVPKHVLEKASDPNTAPFNGAPVGTGPFRWGERAAGDHLLLRANSAYHGDGPYLERVVFKYIPDLTVLYTQFRTGQVDYLGIGGIAAHFVKEAQGLRPAHLALTDAVHRAYRAQPRIRPLRRQSGARGALSRHEQGGADRRALLRPAGADGVLPAARILGL